MLNNLLLHVRLEQRNCDSNWKLIKTLKKTLESIKKRKSSLETETLLNHRIAESVKLNEIEWSFLKPQIRK